VLFPGTRQYYERYQTFLNDDGLYTVSGNEARAMDARVAAVNRAIVRRMCGLRANLTCNPAALRSARADPAKRTTLADLSSDTAAMAWRYDAKHIGPNGGDTVEVEMRLGGRDCRLRLDNRENPLRASGPRALHRAWRPLQLRQHAHDDDRLRPARQPGPSPRSERAPASTCRRWPMRSRRAACRARSSSTARPTVFSRTFA
jgi:hypothetical protein